MKTSRPGFLQRGIALLLAITLALAGCASPQPGQQRPPPSITLAGIAIDGVRLAGEYEAGYVRVWREGRPVDARSGTTLYRGDFIETTPRADAVIRFPNGSVLYMRPDSRGRIGTLSEAVGEFFARVKGVFSIESSFVRAAADGTAFLVRARPDGEMSVTVLEGRVNVDSTRGAWPRFSIGAGAMVVAQAQASPVMAANPQDMRRTMEWADGLDRLMPQPTSDSGSSVGTAVAVGVAIAAAAALLSAGRDKDDDDDRGGRDSPQRSPDAQELAAPLARGVGSTDAGKPSALNCDRPAMLSWRGVPGARDYLVTLQASGSVRPSWATVSTQASADQRIEVAVAQGRSYRWWVQARDARGRSGPGSAMRFFYCR